MSIKSELTKKVFGVPLFIIIFGCIMIGGVLAESVNFTFDMSGVTHTQESPPTGEESATITFEVVEKIEYLDVHTEVSGNAVLGDSGVYAKCYVTNNHPTETYSVTMLLTYTMEGEVDHFTQRVTGPQTIAPGTTEMISDMTYVPLPSSGICTLEVAFQSLTVV